MEVLETKLKQSSKLMYKNVTFLILGTKYNLNSKLKVN